MYIAFARGYPSQVTLGSLPVLGSWAGRGVSLWRPSLGLLCVSGTPPLIAAKGSVLVDDPLRGRYGLSRSLWGGWTGWDDGASLLLGRRI